MIRLFSTSVFSKLCRHSLPLLPAAVKEGAIRRLPFSLHGCRLFSAGCPARKDVPPKPEQPEEGREKLDLDVWKSLMRSQVSADEKQDGDDGEGAEGVVTPGGAPPPGDATEESTLEATRELVLMWREAGKSVPAQMTDEQLQELTKLTTKSAKKKYLKFLAIKEGLKKNFKEKQQKRRAERESMKDAEDEEGEGQQPKNTFLLQFWNRSLDKLLGWRSAQAMIFGQPLVFDLSYEQNMTPREITNTVAQLMEVEAWNRRAVEPFHLHFCNLQPDGAYMKELHKRYGAESWDRLLMTSTNQQHVDVFPRERLVYLTADSPNILRTIDHTKVYIVGALVDRSIQKGVSLANAKRLNLATARLPLDEFLHWDIGAKNLTLDQMIRILLTLKDTGKWEDALSFVPKRKHDGFHQQQPEKRFSFKGGYKDKKASGAKATHMVYNESSFAPGSRPAVYNESSEANRGAYRMRDSELRGIVRERNGDRIAVNRMAGSTQGDRIAVNRMAGSTQDNKSAVTRLRTSLKRQLEEAKTTRKNKNNWWEQE